MSLPRHDDEPAVTSGRSAPLALPLTLFFLGLGIALTPVFAGPVPTPQGITMIVVGDALWIASFPWLWRATTLRPRQAGPRQVQQRAELADHHERCQQRPSEVGDARRRAKDGRRQADADPDRRYRR